MKHKNNKECMPHPNCKSPSHITPKKKKVLNILLAKFNKSQNLLHQEMHENLTTLPTPHTSSNNIASL
jgi:hypothetical protein